MRYHARCSSPCSTWELQILCRGGAWLRRALWLAGLWLLMWGKGHGRLDHLDAGGDAAFSPEEGGHVGGARAGGGGHGASEQAEPRAQGSQGARQVGAIDGDAAHSDVKRQQKDRQQEQEGPQRD